MANRFPNQYSLFIRNMILCAIGGTEIILICIVALLIFGGKKIPELMRGIGQGVRSFKKGMAEDPAPEVGKKSVEDRYKEREAIKAKIIEQAENERLEDNPGNADGRYE